MLIGESSYLPCEQITSQKPRMGMEEEEEEEDGSAAGDVLPSTRDGSTGAPEYE